MTAAFCFTLAAPIAWGHHFGVAMPIFAILLITLGPRHRSMQFAVAALCYLAFSNDWNVSDLLAGSSIAILQPWRFFAALAVLGLLYQALRDGMPPVTSSDVARPEGARRPLGARPARSTVS